jgi:2-oxoglutarate ferredoxin oxidoreductase subunit alpha
VLLADGMIGQMMEPIRWKPVPKRELPEKVWAAGGRRGRAHNNFITTLRMDAQDCEDYNLAIQAKYNTIQEQEIRWEEKNTEDCEILLVAYGTPARIAMTAVEQLRAQGVAAGLFRPITLWPFPAEPLGRLAAREGVRAVLSVEMSLGQLVEDVRLAVEGRKPVHLLGRAGGQTPTVAQIVTAAREALKGGK